MNQALKELRLFRPKLKNCLESMQRKAFQFIWELQQKNKDYGKVEVTTYYDKKAEYRGTKANGIIIDEASKWRGITGI